MDTKYKNADIVKMHNNDGNSITKIANFLLEKSKNVEGTSKKFNTYYQRVKRIMENFKKLNKGKNRVEGGEFLNDFLSREFDFPKLELSVKSFPPSEIEGLKPTESTSVEIIKDLTSQLKSEKTSTVTLSGELKQKSEIVKKLQRRSEMQISREKQLKTELKRVKQREIYHRSKVLKLENTESETVENRAVLEENIDQLVKENDDLRRQLITMEYERDVAQESIREAQDPIVNLYDEDAKKYTSEVQLCVHSLLENHVSTKRVGPVIEACLKLVGKTPNRVPKTTTVNNMNIQRLNLAQKQLGEELAQQKDTTIETDETSKFGTKFGAYALRDSEGTPYVVGLRELTTKSAKDTLDTFKEILFDIDSRFYDSQNLLTQNILYHIRNTMSDRAATEMKFNELLESYREEILPEIVEDWENLHDEDRRVLSRLNNFFCGLHSLVHIAQTADKALTETENKYFDSNVPILNKQFSKKTESGTTRLIRTACKAFSYHGDEKSGCHGPFMTFIKEFLEENRFRSLPLTPFKGNRFNILFHNAGVVYFFREKMVQFLQGFGSNQWVLHDLRVPFFIAGCRALGLICKFITTPLWNLIERKDIPIMEMNQYYLTLTNYLTDAANNIDDFMSGKLVPFGQDSNIKHDSIYAELIRSTDNDADTSTILSIVLPSVAKLTKNHFKDHLPGGLYDKPSEKMQQETRSVAKHNKFSESVFAYLDALLRYKPHIKTLSAESYIMFSMNKTMKWIESKDEEEMKQILDEAYKNVEKTREKFSERKQEIARRKYAILQEKMKKAEEAKLREQKNMLLQTNDILYWGLWQTVDQVENVLKPMNEKDKVEALKAQLRFRKNILQQRTSTSEIFNFTKSEGKAKKRRNLTSKELTENVKKLVEESFLIVSEGQDKGVDLVGRNVQHRFEEGGQKVWYDGFVVSQVPGFPDWFNIKYSEDPAIYSYRLKNDLESGDLKIQV